MGSPQSVDDLFRADDYVQTAWMTEHYLVGVGNVPLVEIRDNPPGHYPDPPMADFMLQLMTTGAGQATFDLGAGRFERRFAPGDLLLAPPETDTDYQLDAAFGLKLIGLPSNLFDALGVSARAGGSPDLERLHTSAHRDPLVEQLVLTLFDEAIAGNPNGALFVDHAMSMLASALLRWTGERYHRSFPEERGLSPAQLEAVVVMMEDRLDERVTLSDLAGLLERDVSSFSRAFKAATGQAPYQFLLDRRVARARQALENGDDSIATIALDCGFSSQAHLTNTFTRRLGVSPGALRRAAR